MHYRILGPVRVWRGETELALGPPKQQALLALLLARAGQLLTPQEVIDALWEEPPGSAVNVVHRHVGALRRLLEPELPSRAAARRLLRGAGGYRLRVDPGELDLLRFRALRQDAGRAAAGGDRARGVALLLDALGMWGGPAGTGLAPRVAAHPLFTALNHEYLATVKEAAEAALATEHAHVERVLTLLEQATHHYPFDEALHARLVTVLAALGRQAEALAVHESVRSRLAGELGVDPGPELRAAHERVLRQALPVVVPAPAVIAGEDTTVVGAGREPETRPAPSLLPAQLPSDIAGFAGRRAELALSRELLDAAGDGRGDAPGDGMGDVPGGRPGDGRATSAIGTPAAGSPAADTGTPVVAISGMAGVGKTTLAVHWAHRVAHRFPDGQLYVNLRGFHPTMAPLRAPDVMREVLSAVGVPPQRVPENPEALPAFYRSLLAPRRLLILLDNARDSEQVRSLLPGTPGCLTLITSRHRLDGLVITHAVRFLGLDVLSRDEGIEFLTRRLGEDRIAAEPGAAEEIVELCGHLPLALAIVCARAQVNPRFALDEVATELRATRGSLDSFTSSDASADVRSVFSWSYRALSPAAARLFRLLGGAHSGPELSVPAAASLAGVPLRDARRQIGELLESHLLLEDSPGRFSCHELLRAYAKELSQDRDADVVRARARHRLGEHYLHSAQAADALLAPYRDRVPLPPPSDGVVPEEPAGEVHAAQWLHRQRQVLLAAVERAAADGDDGLSWRLAATLELFLDRAGRWDEQRDVQERALRAARMAGDTTGQAYALRALGFAYCRLGRHEESRAALSAALDRFTAAGDADGQATAHRNLAFLCNSRGDHARALDHYRLASALYDLSGHRTGAAAVLNEIGWTHILTGSYEQALSDCGKAVLLHQENGNRNGEAAAWDSVGYARHHRGEYREALAAYEKAMALYRDIGDLSLQADTLTHLGDSHEAAGGTSAAAVAWREALELFEHLGHPDARQVRERLARPAPPDRG